MSLTKATFSMIDGAVVNALDFGADPTGSADSTSAIVAAIGTGAKTVFLPVGTYKITSTILVPDNTQIIGAGWQATILSVEADVVGIETRRWCVLSEFKVLGNFVGHTKNGIDIGGSGEGQRTALKSVWVQDVGNDGIAIRNGNVGSIQDVAVVDCGRDGIHFGIESADCNAWTLTGFLDIRGNGRDGVHIESGAGAVTGSVSHFISGLVSQNNTRYGLYVGTRSHVIECYCEANGTSDTYLDTYAKGCEVKTTQGAVVNNSSDPKSNLIQNYNASAQYWRLFQEKTQFSGGSGKGIRIAATDGTAGVLDIEKTAVRQYKLIADGSGAEQTLFIEHADPAYQFVTRTQALRPTVDNTYEFGTGSLRWTTLYATTGTINTSDERQKQNIELLSDAEKRVAVAIKGLIKKFRFKDAVEKKGDDARIHVGVIAQEVKSAFEAEGLNPDRYGLFCYDEWEDENGVMQNRYGIRYEELLAFVISTL